MRINKTFPYTDRAVTYSYSSGQFNLNGTANNNNIYMMIYEPNGTPIFNSGDTITVKSETNWDYTSRVEFLKSDSKFLVGATKNSTQTITFEADCYGYRVWYNATDNKNFSNIYQKIEIEKGTTTPSEYVTPQEQNYNINLGSLELCKIGNYQDYLYKNNNKWYKHNAVGKEKVTTVTRNSTSNANYFRWFADLTNSTQCDTTHDLAYCNLSKITNSGQTFNLYKGFTITSANIFCLYEDEYREYTLEQMLTYLSNNDLFVYHPLKVPTDTEITDTTLISQLNAWYNAQSVDDITYITIDGDLPIQLKLRALKK